jgi:hypothetical protein
LKQRRGGDVADEKPGAPALPELDPALRRDRHALTPTVPNPGGPMPQILVVTDAEEQNGSAVVYRERVASSDLESAYFSGQLVERVGWAIRDAAQIERADPRVTPIHRDQH